MMSTRLQMNRIADLWKLQEIDSALDSRRASLEDAESRLGSSEDVEAARATLDERMAAKRAAESAQKDVEIQADDLKLKIAPAEEKLYGGSIKNPRELSDLQADIDQLKRQLSAAEDADLAALGAAEAADIALRETESELAALEAAWREEQAEARERIARLSVEIAGYDAARDERASGVDGDLLRNYDHVRRAHHGRGMAKHDRNLCLGCRISLPVQTVNRARAGSTLVQCPNCERILYA